MPDSTRPATVFTDALDRTDPADRAAYLDRACGGDADLRRRVEELLAAHAGAAVRSTAAGRSGRPAATGTSCRRATAGLDTDRDRPPAAPAERTRRARSSPAGTRWSR